jgi:hypothetical protein
MGKIGEVGSPSIGGEAFANEVGNRPGRFFGADNCNRTGGRILDLFEAR